MTDRTPPKLATAILMYLGPNNDALAGDLREEYTYGKSAWWYRRQVVIAILLAPSRAFRHSKPVAVGVIATAAVLMPFAQDVSAPLRGWLLYRLIQPAAWEDPFVAAHGLIWMWMNDVAPLAMAATIGGWIVGRAFRLSNDLLTLFAASVLCSVSVQWTIAVAHALSSSKHMPLVNLVLFATTQAAVPSMLALWAGSRRIHQSQ